MDESLRYLSKRSMKEVQNPENLRLTSCIKQLRLSEYRLVDMYSDDDEVRCMFGVLADDVSGGFR